MADKEIVLTDGTDNFYSRINPYVKVLSAYTGNDYNGFHIQSGVGTGWTMFYFDFGGRVAMIIKNGAAQTITMINGTFQSSSTGTEGHIYVKVGNWDRAVMFVSTSNLDNAPTITPCTI